MRQTILFSFSFAFLLFSLDALFATHLFLLFAFLAHIFALLLKPYAFHRS